MIGTPSLALTENRVAGAVQAAAGSCCVSRSGAGLQNEPTAVATGAGREAIRSSSVPIPGGLAEVGTDEAALPQDGEGPRRFIRVKPFRIGQTAVTNAQFATFIGATGYVTDAERWGWSYVFHLFVPPGVNARAVARIKWWHGVEGARWDRPEGPGSTIEGREDHPVVHVSWNDAVAFAQWAGGRLPTEAEWEHAARGGLAGSTYPWGNAEPDDSTFAPCNIWQGQFPNHNSAVDGYAGLAPARSFEANAFGLYNMSGNCWEWTADPFRIRSIKKQVRLRNEQAIAESQRLLKGGSYLCHKSYCYRYRIAARMGNTPDTTSGHTGFRMAFDA